MEEELLTKQELSKLLKVTEATIDRWRKAGMPFIKTGKLVRFKKEEVMDWFKSQQK